MQGVKVLTRQEMADLSVIGLGRMEQLAYSLYDIQSYAAAGQSTLTFFKRGTSGTVTQSDTNLDLGGQLPKGNHFVLKRLSLRVFPGAAVTSANFVNDQVKALHFGNVEVKIGSKPYRQIAPAIEAADGGLDGFAATTAGELFYAATRSKVSTVFDPWLLIPETFNFQVVLSYPEGNQAISAAARLGIYLHGYLLRPVQ